ncbi:centromere protein J-like isoform X3 [Mustela putorius furo]|uniref:Centromere protein J-like isoform X3 n=1 Tax=Mustela putorius furo TaxID=9669 RepID=A0A8U0S6L9_MUSPF|nr:centromere protein J-like isoform X3 [Mustela putorius furo]
MCFWVRTQPRFGGDPVPSRAEEEEGRRPPSAAEKPPSQSHSPGPQLEREREQGHRMLTADDPAEPAETGRPREDGGPGAHAKDTATLSGEHGPPERTLSQQLQQQVAQLHEALRSQESRWAAAQRHLQSQIDALVQQNLELRDELTAPRPLWEADAALGARLKLDTLATHQSSQSLQEPSGQKSPEAAASVARLQECPAAQGKGTRPLPCKGPEGGLLSRERAGRSACSPPGTARPQNPPGEPGPSRVDAQTEQGDQEEGMRSPASEVYGSADAGITHTTRPSGPADLRFPEQTEKYHPDGSTEIVHPDGTVRRLSGGREETVFPDGTVVTVERNGDRTIVLSNGQREIQTAGFTRREYPDGAVRTVYCTGSQETRSASGTVSIRPRRRRAGFVLTRRLPGDESLLEPSCHETWICVCVFGAHSCSALPDASHPVSVAVTMSTRVTRAALWRPSGRW